MCCAAISGTSTSTLRPSASCLEKNLPIASGIGGGSADAAATLRALVRLWNAAVTPAELADLARSVGADVPMCLASRPLLAEGIGDRLRPLAPFPTFDMVLVHPGRAVPTPEVFRTLRSRANPALEVPRRWGRLPEAVAALSAMRNDLESAAQEIAPEIGLAKSRLEEGGALLARMSGSGASCFGIFSGAEAARAATRQIRRLRTGVVRRRLPDFLRRIGPFDIRTFDMQSSGAERPFIPVGIAVLTVSDTRGLAEDRSGETLADAHRRGRAQAGGNGRSCPTSASSSPRRCAPGRKTRRSTW